MRYVNGEVLFKNYDEACLHQLVLEDHLMSMYNCVICGINFATIDPYCADYGITCRVCVKTLNLSENDNYRPDLDGPAEDDQLFEPYDDDSDYGREIWQ
jgi:hypothetical protein